MMLWATYEEALCLLITGKPNRPQKPKQFSILRQMFARGHLTSDRVYRHDHLPQGVRTEVVKGVRLYHIPDLTRFMLNAFRDEWDIQSPPLDLDYLNSLKDESGHPIFSFTSPGAKAWSDSTVGARHWELVCEEIRIHQELEVQRGMHHAGDPVKWRQIEDNIRELNARLESVRSEQEELETGGSETRRLIPLTPPQRERDTWPEVIMASIKEFEQEHGFTGSEAQIWVRLCSKRPAGWEYRVGNSALKMGSENLSRQSFGERFQRLYPNEKP